MIKITEEQKSFLYNQDIDITDAISTDNVDLLLEVVDDAIVDNIVDNNEEPDEIGIKLQRIYDQIRNQNS